MGYVKEMLIFIFIMISCFGWGLLAVGILNRILIIVNIERLEFSNLGEEILFLFTFGFGFTSILFFIIGFLQLYYFSIALIVFSIGFLKAVQKLVYSYPKIGSIDLIRKPNRVTSLIALLSGVSGISSLLYIFVVNTLMPPFEWDEIAYHLAVPKIYITSHQITYIPTILQSNWPMAIQMLYTGCLLLGGEIAIHMLTFSMAALTGMGIVLIAGRFINWKTGWIASSIFLNIPLVWRLSGTGLIDIAMAFFIAPVLLSLFYFQNTRKVSWLVTCGILCGFIASTKQTGIVLAAIIGLVILISFRRNSLTIQKRMVYIVILGLIAFMISLPWFIKNTVFTNDPLFPFLYKFLGGKNWDIAGSIYFQEVWRAIYEELPRNFSGLLSSINYIFFSPQKLGGYSGGIGIIALSFFLVGLFLAAFFSKSTPVEIYDMILLTIFFYLFWFYFASLEIRYLFPIFVPIAIIAGFAVTELCWKVLYILKNRIFQKFVALLVISLFCTILLNGSLPFSQTRRKIFTDRAKIIFGGISKEDFLNSRIDVLPAIRYINQNLPLDAFILLTPYENRGYYLDRQYIVGHPANQRYIRFNEFPTTESLAEYLRSLGINYILDNPTWLFTDYESWEHDRKLMIGLQEQCGEMIFNQNNAVLYKLTSCKK